MFAEMTGANKEIYNENIHKRAHSVQNSKAIRTCLARKSTLYSGSKILPVKRWFKIRFSYINNIKMYNIFREGRYSIPSIAPLYPWFSPYCAECLVRRHQTTIFWVLGMTRPGIEPRSHRQLINTLLIRSMAIICYTRNHLTVENK